MASIEKLKKGQIVFDCRKYKISNTFGSRLGVWPIEIVDIDLDKRTVLASWNWNPPKQYSYSQVKKWRVKNPFMKKGIKNG